MGKYERSWAEEQRKQEDIIVNSFKWLGGVTFCVIMVGLLMTECSDQTVRAIKDTEELSKAVLTSEQAEYRDFFKGHGSPASEQMAIAVTKTKRPAFMAAIAVVESNGDPKAVGDNGASKGAFQVQEKHWGKVPTTAVEQALQAERILEELLSSRRALRRGGSRLRVALARYNGGDRPPRISYKYADKVMRLAK